MCKPVFKNYVLAGYPLLWVETYEEHRALTSFAVEMESSKEKIRLYTWDRVDGIKEVRIKKGAIVSGAVKIEGVEEVDPLTALQWADTRMPDNSILFLKDFHHYAKKDVVSRKVRNLVPEFKAKGKCLVILSHTIDIPAELEKEIAVIRFQLPDMAGLRIVLKGICESAEAPYPENDEPVLEAALGMTSFEAENAFAVSLIEAKSFDEGIVRREKAAVVKKTGLLEVVETKQTLADVGGLDNLKAWLESRAACFTEKAREYGVVPPKGILLIGIPGTGKTLTARAVASTLHRPLLRLEMGKVFGSYVGESEGNIRKCLAIAEAVSPCVLMIDELEKAFAGTSGSNDSGTTRRVFGSFLTWMSDKTADVFIVATANKVDMLPPELLRSGRFDALFWVDLPSTEEREGILSIHLDKHGWGKALIDKSLIASKTEGFSGAELETLVKESLVKAYSSKEAEPTTENFLSSVQEITPIAVLMKEELAASRKWAEARGVRPAGKKEIESDAPLAKKERVIRV